MKKAFVMDHDGTFLLLLVEARCRHSRAESVQRPHTSGDQRSMKQQALGPSSPSISLDVGYGVRSSASQSDCGIIHDAMLLGRRMLQS